MIFIFFSNRYLWFNNAFTISSGLNLILGLLFFWSDAIKMLISSSRMWCCLTLISVFNVESLAITRKVVYSGSWSVPSTGKQHETHGKFLQALLRVCASPVIHEWEMTAKLGQYGVFPCKVCPGFFSSLGDKKGSRTCAVWLFLIDLVWTQALP